MAIGRNPHVPRAQASEQKAADAPDAVARVRALRDAAHQWDRAAEREKPGKVRLAYEANAERNRRLADEPGSSFTDDVDDGSRLELVALDDAGDLALLDPSQLN